MALRYKDYEEYDERDRLPPLEADPSTMTAVEPDAPGGDERVPDSPTRPAPQGPAVQPRQTVRHEPMASPPPPVPPPAPPPPPPALPQGYTPAVQPPGIVSQPTGGYVPEVPVMGAPSVPYPVEEPQGYTPPPVLPPLAGGGQSTGGHVPGELVEGYRPVGPGRAEEMVAPTGGHVPEEPVEGAPTAGEPTGLLPGQLGDGPWQPGAYANPEAFHQAKLREIEEEYQRRGIWDPRTGTRELDTATGRIAFIDENGRVLYYSDVPEGHSPPPGGGEKRTIYAENYQGRRGGSGTGTGGTPPGGGGTPPGGAGVGYPGELTDGYRQPPVLPPLGGGGPAAGVPDPTVPSPAAANQPTVNEPERAAAEQRLPPIDSHFERGEGLLRDRMGTFRDDLTRDLSEHMASRGTLGSSVEEFGAGQIGSRVMSEYSRGLYDLDSQARAHGLQREQMAQQESQFARSFGLQERAMALQAKGMDRDEAFRQASLDQDKELRSRAMDLQQQGLNQEEAYRYAALYQDSRFREAAEQRMNTGMQADVALRAAEQAWRQEYGQKELGMRGQELQQQTWMLTYQLLSLIQDPAQRQALIAAMGGSNNTANGR